MTSNERHEPDLRSEPQGALAGSRRPVEDLPHGRERRNPKKASAHEPVMAIALAAIAGVIILVIGGLRGFEAAIAAAIAASATVTGLWIWRATGDGDIWDSLVPVLFVGVGTLLALIILGGIAAAIGQGVRAARFRRATDDGRRPS